MALIYLLRHAHSEANGAGILAGRASGVRLSEIGRRQADEIAMKLAREEFSAIYHSPMERCSQTIAPLAKRIGKRSRSIDEFIEMDYGKWTGRSLKELTKEPLWRDIKRRPSEVRFPSGESFRGAQRRIIRGLNAITRRHPKGKILVVSHGDIIKLAIQETLAGDLDKFQRIVIDPASLSVLNWKERTVVSINQKLVTERGKKSLGARRVLGGGSNV